MKWIVRIFLTAWLFFAGYSLPEMAIVILECLDVKGEPTQEVVITEEKDEAKFIFLNRVVFAEVNNKLETIHGIEIYKYVEVGDNIKVSYSKLFDAYVWDYESQPLSFALISFFSFLIGFCLCLTMLVKTTISND